ncbi:MAG: vWA domain-containing protein [Pseudomonadota bacterium]
MSFSVSLSVSRFLPRFLPRFLLWALIVAAQTAVAGCGRTPALEPLRPIGSQPAIDLLPVFTQSVNNDIDIVFLIDNSGSMEQEQENLRRNFPVFTRALKSLPQGLPNVHIGVVSSDLGSGRFDTVRGCTPPGGQGRFQNAPRAGGCAGPRDAYISAVSGVQNFDGDIDQVFSCIASLGMNGCGFEHQLQALRTALDPELMPLENRGFLREEAVLAVILLTDEDDCSAPPNSALFDPSQTLVSDPLGPVNSYRCNEFGHLCAGQRPPRAPATNLEDCHSAEDGRLIKVSELVEFFKTLKADPNDVIVAAITGPEAPYAVTLERQQIRGTTQLEPKIVPSCRSANGTADPAVRIHEFVKAFGRNGTSLSICADDFSPVMARIGEEVARRASLECLADRVADTDLDRPGLQAHCEVHDETTGGGATLRQLIPACAAGAPPCWRIEPSTKCATSDARMVVDRAGVAPPVGTRVRVTCETCDKPDDRRCD